MKFGGYYKRRRRLLVWCQMLRQREDAPHTIFFDGEYETRMRQRGVGQEQVFELSKINYIDAHCLDTLRNLAIDFAGNLDNILRLSSVGISSETMIVLVAERERKRERERC